MNKPLPFSTFENASLEALRTGARMTLREKIDWLEEAEEFSVRLQKSRWQSGLPVDSRLRAIMRARFGEPSNPSRARKTSGKSCH